MSTPPLFQPISCRSVAACNRIVVAPICQCSANDGLGNDWHVQHPGARDAGFRIAEIHSAYGYLGHPFLSPVSNHRTGSYGAALQGRMRCQMELVEAVRREWLAELPQPRRHRHRRCRPYHRADPCRPNRRPRTRRCHAAGAGAAGIPSLAIARGEGFWGDVTVAAAIFARWPVEHDQPDRAAKRVQADEIGCGI
jgi:NADH:flavin oxidoreductase / NADH oxidase family